MNNQVLFSLQDRSKKLKCRLLQFLLCALRVKKIQLKQKQLTYRTDALLVTSSWQNHNMKNRENTCLLLNNSAVSL